MKIQNIRLQSFGAFSDTGHIELSPDMNIIVGENNSGKSAILRSFAAKLKENPHRSPSEYRLGFVSPSLHVVSATMSGDEIRTAWGGTQVAWPRDTANTMDQNQLAQEIEGYLSKASNVVHLARTPNVFFRSLVLPTHRGWEGPYNQLAIFHLTQGHPVFQTWRTATEQPENLAEVALDAVWTNKVFLFEAIRSSPGRAGFGAPSRLDTNATNLARELNGLHGTDAFDRLVAHLRAIFSTVGNLSVSPHTGELEIRVWPTVEKGPLELSFSLDDSGTGLAQAISILYVAMTMRDAVIAIDEISSYLHPSAAKALIRILQNDYPQHQYIISTHSPEVLSAGRDASVFWVRKSGYKSLVTAVDLNDLDQLRHVTGTLGISLTDVFAAEHIIWVEGETEENCFPLLLQAQKLPRSTQFISLIATDDGGRSAVRKQLILGIYRKLSAAIAAVGSKVAFGFDSEVLSQSQKDDVIRESKGRVSFLPRRNFESYLLHPSAIARVIAASVALIERLDVAQTEAKVISALNAAGGLAEFGARREWNGNISDAGWLGKVDGAKLLANVFLEVTGKTLEFRKTTHSTDLIRDLLEHDPEHLSQLTAYVSGLVRIAAT